MATFPSNKADMLRVAKPNSTKFTAANQGNQWIPPGQVRSVIDTEIGGVAVTVLTTHRPINEAMKTHFRNRLGDPNLLFSG